MAWSDRDQHRDPDERQGFWSSIGRVLRRAVGPGDNFMSWSLPLYTLWGIAVRVHLFYVAWMLFRLVASAFPDQLDVRDVLLQMGSLFVIVLLHEYGHCFACRWRKGEADRILMWPLGGLASCDPPDTWRDNLITTAGGPAVNLALMPVLGAVVYLTSGSWEAVLFNPFAPSDALLGLDTWTLRAIYWVHVMNVFLFAFNVFLPMYPMDGGRLLDAFLWAKLGKHRARTISANVGLGVAIVVGLFALTVRDASMLLGIAIFGGFCCWRERQRLRFAAEGDADEPWRASLDSYEPGADTPSRAERAEAKAAEKQAERAEREQAEIDRILEKISASGMGSLTRSERKTLDRASKKSGAD